MRTFVGGLAQQVGGLVRVGETTRVLSGEFIILVLDSGNHQIKRQAGQGAPLRHVIPADGPIAGFWYLGVPRTAAHPNLAKLLLNALMSEEGQRTLYQVNFADHYALPGSQSAADLEALTARGVDLLRIDARFVAEHPEMNALQEELARILRDKS
jgi:ABC-type Fe3+ transport system substrate-binding protein